MTTECVVSLAVMLISCPLEISQFSSLLTSSLAGTAGLWLMGRPVCNTWHGWPNFWFVIRASDVLHGRNFILSNARVTCDRQINRNGIVSSQCMLWLLICYKANCSYIGIRDKYNFCVSATQMLMVRLMPRVTHHYIPYQPGQECKLFSSSNQLRHPNSRGSMTYNAMAWHASIWYDQQVYP